MVGTATTGSSDCWHAWTDQSFMGRDTRSDSYSVGINTVGDEYTVQGGASDKMHDHLCRNAHLRNCEIVR